MKFIIRIFLKFSNLINSLNKRIRTSILISQFHKVGKSPNFNFPIYTHGLANISIGDHFIGGERIKLRTYSDWRGTKFAPSISIGNNVHIGTDCQLSTINEIIIEDGVLLASFVYISDISHGKIDKEELPIPPLERPLYSKGPIRICKNVWIGEKASILPGVTIGEGSIIGANSVVTHDIPPFSIACGAPARIIRKLK